jgi:hypothetical protein
MDAASNLIHNSFFKVFSPGRFPVLNELSGSFHMGVLSIFEKFPTTLSA